MVIIEDDEADVFLIQEAIEITRLSVTLHVVKDGKQAVQFFDRIERDPALPCPALVILDINLPKVQGGDVLRHMRHGAKCAQAAVIVVSTSDSRHDRDQMASLGAHAYFRKPSDYDDFMKLGEMIKFLLAP